MGSTSLDNVAYRFELVALEKRVEALERVVKVWSALSLKNGKLPNLSASGGEPGLKTSARLSSGEAGRLACPSVALLRPSEAKGVGGAKEGIILFRKRKF